MKSLFSDAGSGILFNLAGDVILGNEMLPQGVIMLPVKKISQKIALFPNAQLAGIRFHPAIGYGVIGQHFDKPTLLSDENDHLYNLYRLFSELKLQKDNKRRIDTLHCWINDNFNFTNLIPNSLEKALECINHDVTPGKLNEQVALGQRQIERLFKHWIAMTPKQYQRILRVNKAIRYLRQHKQVNLVDVSQQFGFSDQAHMTREFRAIACITPGKINNRS